MKDAKEGDDDDDDDGDDNDDDDGEYDDDYDNGDDIIDWETVLYCIQQSTIDKWMMCDMSVTE